MTWSILSCIFSLDSSLAFLRDFLSLASSLEARLAPFLACVDVSAGESGVLNVSSHFVNVLKVKFSNEDNSFSAASSSSSSSVDKSSIGSSSVNACVTPALLKASSAASSIGLESKCEGYAWSPFILVHPLAGCVESLSRIVFFRLLS